MRLEYIRLVRVALSSLLALGLAGCAKNDDVRILGHWRAEPFKAGSLIIPISPEFVIRKEELAAVGTDLHIPITSISHDGDEVTVNTTGGIGLSFYFENSDRMYFDVPLFGKIYYQRVNPVPHEVRISESGKTESSATVPAATPVLVSTVSTIVEIPKASAVEAIARDTGFVPDSVHTAVSKVEELTTSAVVSTPDIGNADLHRLVRAAEHQMDQGNLDAAQSMLIDARRIDHLHPIVDYNLAVLRTKQGNSEAAIQHLKDAFDHGFRAFSLLEANPDLAALKSDARYNMLVARYK